MIMFNIAFRIVAMSNVNCLLINPFIFISSRWNLDMMQVSTPPHAAQESQGNFSPPQGVQPTVVSSFPLLAQRFHRNIIKSSWHCFQAATDSWWAGDLPNPA